MVFNDLQDTVILLGMDAVLNERFWMANSACLRKVGNQAENKSSTTEKDESFGFTFSVVLLLGEFCVCFLCCMKNKPILQLWVSVLVVPVLLHNIFCDHNHVMLHKSV